MSNFAERISRCFGIFSRNDPDAKYGLFELINDKGKLVTSGTKESCEESRKRLEEQLRKKTPKYVVRKLDNLWSFSEHKIDPIEYSCSEVISNLENIIEKSKDRKLSDGAKKILSQFEELCRRFRIINFAEEFDSSEVETKWTPPENLFAEGSAKEIAKEVHKSHDSLKSAIACLNFYLNRGGDNIPENRKKVIEEAKDLVRDMYE